MKQQWRCVSALKFGTLSTCSTSIPRWPRRSRLLPSHASKIRRNSPAARNNFPQVKTCRQSRTLTADLGCSIMNDNVLYHSLYKNHKKRQENKIRHPQSLKAMLEILKKPPKWK